MAIGSRVRRGIGSEKPVGDPPSFFTLSGSCIRCTPDMRKRLRGVSRTDAFIHVFTRKLDLSNPYVE
jgi:hypothetical protein